MFRAILVLLALASPGALAASPTADEILQRADEIRFPQTGFEVEVRVRNRQDGRDTDERTFKVMSKGNENTIVLTTAPAAERGQILLMKGRDLWLYLPKVSQPVRLSLAQRLTGEVANGDIARANFTGDYTPKLAGTERIGKDEHYILELAAVDKRVTYQRVRFWVRSRDFYPHKAEFYSVSDRLLKTCHYDNFRNLGGRVRPTRLVMSDALNKGSSSVLEYSDLTLRDIPDHMFSREYLRRLQ